MYVSRSGNSAGRRHLVLVAALFATFLASPLYAVTVNVDVNNVKAVLPLEGLGMGTAVYANQFSNAQLDDRLNEAGVTTLRYSGGGYADIYHWSEHKDNPFGGTSDRGYVASQSTFPGLVNIMNNMNTGSGAGQAVLTVNYGSALKLNAAKTQADAPNFGGQPQEAAAWVAYANGDSSIFGTGADKTIGSNIKLLDGITPDPAARIDQQGNDWKTIGFWSKLRASKPGFAPPGTPEPAKSDYFAEWAGALYNPNNNFLAIDRDAPVGVNYWEIGNETFGTGYYGGGNGYSTDYHAPYNHSAGSANLSPAHYGQEVVKFSEMMKEVDPNIKIGAVMSTPPDDYSWDVFGGKHWNNEVLSQTGVSNNVDFVMVHWYPYIGETFTDSNSNGTQDPGEAVNNGAALLATPRTKIGPMINGAGSHTGANAGVRDLLATNGIPDAEIMVTEFGYFGEVWGGGVNNPTNYRRPAQALFVADAYASWLELGVTSVQLLEMSKNEFIGDSGSLTRGSEFYAIQMLNYMADPGDEAVTSTSSSNNIRVHSALQDDGTVAVMILNMNDATANVDITINGDLLSTDGTLYSTTGSGITTTPMSGLGNTFSVLNMPARTNYLFLIPTLPPDPVLFGDFNDDGVVDALDYTVWRNNFGDANEDNINNSGDGLGGVDELDFDLWKLHYGDVAPPPGGGGLAAIPEPSTICLLVVGAMSLIVRRSRMSH